MEKQSDSSFQYKIGEQYSQIYQSDHYIITIIIS